MISVLGNLFAKYLFRNRTTSVVSAFVIAALALFTWHQFDKQSAVRQAVIEYVADTEIKVLQAQIDEANHRAEVAEDASAALSKRLSALEAEAAQHQQEIEEYAASLEDVPACRPDDDFLDGLLTR